MHATDIHPILQACRNIERKDLVHALRLCGGEYHFSEYHKNKTDDLYIEYNEDTNGPSSALVLRAGIEEREEDGIRVTGVLLLVKRCHDEPKTISDQDVYPGFLSTLTRHMDSGNASTARSDPREKILKGYSVFEQTRGAINLDRLGDGDPRSSREGGTQTLYGDVLDRLRDLGYGKNHEAALLLIGDYAIRKGWRGPARKG